MVVRKDASMTQLHLTSIEVDRPFSDIELRSMYLAGEITRHGIFGYEFYLPVGCVAGRHERAASLLPLMRPGRTISGRAARWVHAGGPVPDAIEMSRRSGKRLQSPEPIQCRYRRLTGADVTTVAGLVVTTIERTIRDLRRDGLHTDAKLLEHFVTDSAQEAPARREAR